MAGHEIQSETGTHTDGVQKSLALDPKKKEEKKRKKKRHRLVVTLLKQISFTFCVEANESLNPKCMVNK